MVAAEQHASPWPVIAPIRRRALRRRHHRPGAEVTGPYPMLKTVPGAVPPPRCILLPHTPGSGRKSQSRTGAAARVGCHPLPSRHGLGTGNPRRRPALRPWSGLAASANPPSFERRRSPPGFRRTTAGSTESSRAMADEGVQSRVPVCRRLLPRGRSTSFRTLQNAPVVAPIALPFQAPPFHTADHMLQRNR